MAEKKPTSGRKSDQKMKPYLVYDCTHPSDVFNSVKITNPSLARRISHTRGSPRVWLIVFYWCLPA